MIDGQFPDYTRVIPTGNKAATWFEPGPLAEAVDRVLTISSGKTRAIAMEFAAEAGTLQVISTENGTESAEMRSEYDGDPLRRSDEGRVGRVWLSKCRVRWGGGIEKKK